MLLLEMPRDAVETEPQLVPARSGAATRARALAALALPVHSGVPISDSLGLGRQALELAVGEADPAVLAYASSNLGIAALAGGRTWGWSLVEQGLSAARAVDDRREVTRVILNAVTAALWLGEHPRAQSLLQDLGVLAAGTGCGWTAERVAILRAEIAFRVRGLLASEDEETLPAEPAVALLRARVALLAGDPDWAELMLLPVAERGFDEGYPDLAASACARLAEIAMGRGDVQASISWAGRAVAPARAGAVAWWGDSLAPAVAALCQHDMVPEAEEILVDAESGLRDATAPRAGAALLQAHGMVAEAMGNDSQARSMYVAASRRFADLPEFAAERACAAARDRLETLSER
jgi:hypothetical protein